MMARFYVEKDGAWNVFSSIVDDFLIPEFVSFSMLKAFAVGEAAQHKAKEIDSLQSPFPKLNTMSYDEAMEIIEDKKRDDEAWEEETDHE